MHLILTNPRGFCAGVQMAVDVVQQVVDLFPGRTIYVYHEIVHNRHVVDRFKGQGVVFVDDLADIPAPTPAPTPTPTPTPTTPGTHDTPQIVVFSAHGVSPAVRRQAADRGLTAIDATCPLVTKVHSEAVRYARAGYQILLVGHRNHQEVIGTSGEAPDAIQIVESPEDIPCLRILDPARLVYLTQTTLSTDDANVIIAALKKAFPAIKEPPTSDICYATTNRQHAVRELASSGAVDLVLVVGSRNSSNSVRLTEIAENVGRRAYLLDDAGQIDWSWFKSGQERVLITAGASAPEDLVAAICKALLTRYGGTIEQQSLVEEDMEFALPATLRRLMREKGAGQPDRNIRVGTPTITRDLYGAVPLTISTGTRSD